MRTLELRWFLDVELGEDELRAFAGRGEIEIRTDQYRLGVGDEFGVKRRGAAGRLEHKHRLAQTPVVVGTEPPLLGVVEAWEKRWPAPSPTHDPDPTWIAVAKRRAVRDLGRFRVELTDLRCHHGRAQQSLAIETSDAVTVAALVDAAERFFAQDGNLVLARRFATARSCGYPEWLGTKT